MSENEHILIGKIVGVHGIRGGLKVCSYAESDSLFAAGASVFVKNSHQEMVSHIIRETAVHKRGLVLRMEGIEDRSQAETLVGAGLFVRKSDLPEPEEGTYYWHDLIGLSVFDPEDIFLGRLTAIIPTGSNDVYVIKHGSTETLIPAIASVVTGIDLAGKTMRVQLPEGL